MDRSGRSRVSPHLALTSRSKRANVSRMWETISSPRNGRRISARTVRGVTNRMRVDMRNGTCIGNDCDKKATRKGMCGTHYERIRRHADMNYVRPPHVDKGCTVEGCDRGHYSLGYCDLHWQRVHKTGHVGSPGIVKHTTRLLSSDVVGRIMERSTPVGECIEWTGHVMHSGYGVIHWNGRPWVVHRAMWTAQVGPIPTDDDWTIDHLCRNRRCVNVKHMEVVTRTENSLRAGGLVIAQGRNKQRNALRINSGKCCNGHEMTAENTGMDKKTGKPWCRQCKKDAWAKQSATIAMKRKAIYARAKAEGKTTAEAMFMAQKITNY